LLLVREVISLVGLSPRNRVKKCQLGKKLCRWPNSFAALTVSHVFLLGDQKDWTAGGRKRGGLEKKGRTETQGTRLKKGADQGNKTVRRGSGCRGFKIGVLSGILHNACPLVRPQRQLGGILQVMGGGGGKGSGVVKTRKGYGPQTAKERREGTVSETPIWGARRRMYLKYDSESKKKKTRV